MEFGWAENARRLRTRLPNMNLTPVDLLPPPLPWLAVGLAAIVVGLLGLGYALFYVRAYTDLEVQALSARQKVAQSLAHDLGLPVDEIGGVLGSRLPSGTLEDWAELRARQIDWAGLFAVLVNAMGPHVRLGGVNQAGYALSISGEASSSIEANAYLQRLRDSSFFSSLDMSMVGIETPTAVPTLTPRPSDTPLPPLPTRPPPTLPPIAAVIPGLAPSPTRPPALPAPPAVQPTTRPAVATASPTAVGTPKPQYDFIVTEKRESFYPDRTSAAATIRVRVEDAAGNLLPGTRLRIESEGLPAWGDTHPHEGFPASDGRFEMIAGMGKFTLFMLNGSSERATGLYTGVSGKAGVSDWNVTFRKQAPGTPLAGPAICVGCPTPTQTLTPQPTPTTVGPGANIAARGCVTTSHNNPDAYRIVDGNADSGWDAGQGPITQVTFDFTRFPIGHPRGCQVRDDGSAKTVQLESLEMVALLSARTKSTHEIWTMYDTGSVQLEHTFADVDTLDWTTISAKFATPRTIQQLRIRTIRSGVNVGWREVRLFEPLPPGFPVATSTPTATIVPTATATVPVGATLVQVRPPTSSSSQSISPPSGATDGNTSTAWRPQAGQTGHYLRAELQTAQTVGYVRITTAVGGDGVGTSTPTVGPGSPTPAAPSGWFRVAIERSGDAVPCGTSQLSQIDFETIQMTCSGATNATAVLVYIDNPQNNAIPPGIRELVVYGLIPTPIPPTPTNTSTVTPCAGGTCTPTSSPTASPPPPATALPPTATSTVTPADGSSGATDVSATTNAADATKANDGTIYNQISSTYWAVLAPVGTGTEYWRIAYALPITVREVAVRFYAVSSSSGTVTIELLDRNDAVSASRNVVVSTETLTNDASRSMQLNSPIGDIAQVKVKFTGFSAITGIRTIYVYKAQGSNIRAGASSDQSVTIGDIAAWWVRRLSLMPIAEAAELSQVQVPVKPLAPPSGPPGPVQVQPTPVVIGTPPRPGASPAPAAAAAQGRVSFLIIAQARPGGP